MTIQKELEKLIKDEVLIEIEDYIDDLFEIIAKRYGVENSKLFFLSVQNKEFDIRLTKQIVKE